VAKASLEGNALPERRGLVQAKARFGLLQHMFAIWFVVSCHPFTISVVPGSLSSSFIISLFTTRPRGLTQALTANAASEASDVLLLDTGHELALALGLVPQVGKPLVGRWG
jgi:hypothetical protein